MALGGAAVAYYWLHATDAVVRTGNRDYEGLNVDTPYYPYMAKLVALALCVFVLALAGGYYFTYRKNKKLGLKIWNTASRKMLVSLMIPYGGRRRTGAFFYPEWPLDLCGACLPYLLWYGLIQWQPVHHQ